MSGRSLTRALVAFLTVGFLSSGSCYYRACSGDCDAQDHEHARAPDDRLGTHRVDIRGLPPGDVTRLLTRIHGPWLLPEERREASSRADFAGRILAANRDLLGLSATAELEFDARIEGADLLLESHVRDIFGSCRLTLRIEPDGRLSAVRVHRPSAIRRALASPAAGR